MKVGIVEVSVVPVVGRFGDGATPMAKHLLEASIFRAVRIVVAQVPLAKHAGGVAGLLKDLAQGDCVLP